MKLVLLSDIHANVTAFEAVLADMDTIGHCDAIAILGDLVNYGPKLPKEFCEFNFFNNLLMIPLTNKINTIGS